MLDVTTERPLETKRQSALDRIAQEVKDISEGGLQTHFAFREDAPAVQPSLDSSAGGEASPSKACEQCAKPFEPRSRTGGKPQKFCSPDCRSAFHAEAQRGQHTPTLDAPSTLDPIPEPKSKPAPADDPNEFNWASDTDAVILPEQFLTACYFNPKGELVIRQRRWPDDDQFIFIAPESIDTFIDKVTDIVGIPSVGR
jgi:hypothetical protein